VHHEFVPTVQALTTTTKPRTSQWPASALLSMRVLLRRSAFDARLALGEDPQHTPELALRARQICELSTRRDLGRAILAIVDRAEARESSLTSAVPVSRDAVAYAGPALRQLAIALQSPEPVRAHGVAQVLVLLRDAGGPLHAPTDRPSTLYFAVRQALLAMRPSGPCTVELVERGQAG
jgi:hypothetical protein